MTEAERYAIEKGAEASFLDTHSFQARPFYEKLGHGVFGASKTILPAIRITGLRRS